MLSLRPRGLDILLLIDKNLQFPALAHDPDRAAPVCPENAHAGSRKARERFLGGVPIAVPLPYLDHGKPGTHRAQ